MGALIWLASFPKSGNTWTRIFINNLLKNPDEPLSINDLTAFSSGDSGWTHWAQFTDKETAEELTKEDLARLRPRVHRYLTGMHPDSVFVKTHSYLGEDCGVPLITMEVTAGAVYIVRNPLDVVISYSKHMGVDVDRAIAMMANNNTVAGGKDKNILQFYSSWSFHVRSWTEQPHPQIHVMRYEDMLEKPKETFGGLVRFLGLNPPEERLQKAIEFSSFDQLKKQEQERGFKEESKNNPGGFFNTGKRDQWREQLTEEQIESIITRHREQMERFGYVPEEYR